MRCRKCGSKDIRRSKEGGVIDALVHAIFGRVPYRCRSCRARFFAREDSQKPDSDGADPSISPSKLR